MDAPVAAIIAGGARARRRGAVRLHAAVRPARRCSRGQLRIDAAEIDAAAASIAPALLAALDLAATRIEAFHRAQLPADLRDAGRRPGCSMGMRWTPLDAVGLYVPGGKAAYPSSVLMNAMPARVAGVGRIAMCVPVPRAAC